MSPALRPPNLLAGLALCHSFLTFLLQRLRGSNLTADPNEMTNLALQKTPAVAAQIKSLDAALREQVDYPAVTMDVAQYNIDMARWWMESTPGWAAVVNGTWAVTGNRTVPSFKKGSGQLNADWGELWQTVALTGHGASTETYWAAWNEWVHAAKPEITPCGSDLTHNWPPAQAAAAMLSTL